MESDHSEGSTSEHVSTLQSSITLSHHESNEDEEDEDEEEMEEEVSRESDKEDESLTEDITDGGSFSMVKEQRDSSSSSSRGSFEEMRSPSPDESLDKTSSVSEDVDDLEGSLNGSVGSALKQRSGCTQMWTW